MSVCNATSIERPKCVVAEAGEAVVHEQNRLSSAVYIANTMIRDMRRKDMDAAANDYDRLEGVVLASRHPQLFLNDLARRLGRSRALAVGIEREVVDRAVRG